MNINKWIIMKNNDNENGVVIVINDNVSEEMMKNIMWMKMK